MILFVKSDPEEISYQFNDAQLNSNIYNLFRCMSDALHKIGMMGPFEPSKDKSYIHVVNWLVESRENYNWGIECLRCMTNDFEQRFGFRYPGLSFMTYLKDYRSIQAFPDLPRTEFPDCPDIPDIELDRSYNDVHDKYLDVLDKIDKNSLGPAAWWGYVSDV